MTEKKKEHIKWLQLLPCIVCISWLNHGLFAQFGIVNFAVFFCCFGLWFILGLSDRYFVSRYLRENVWLLGYVAMVLLFSVLLDEFWNKYSYTAFYLLIMLMFSTYYRADRYRQERKILWYYYLIEITVIAIVTAYTCVNDPYLARTLAGGVELEEGQSSLFVASFDNIYTFALVVIFAVAVRGKLLSKKLWIVSVAMLIICIYFANFGTAVFISVLFLALMFLVKKPWKILLCVVIVVLLFSSLRQSIADFSTMLSNQTWLSDFLRGKLMDIANTLNGVHAYQDANTLYMRLEYIEDALTVFGKHPLFGVYGFTELYTTERVLLRDHNVWFDMIAYFGVIRIIPFIGFLHSWYTNNKPLFKQFKYSPLAYVLLLWVILGFFNPVNKPAVQVFLFVMLPLSDVLFREEENAAPEGALPCRSGV